MRKIAILAFAAVLCFGALGHSPPAFADPVVTDVGTGMVENDQFRIRVWDTTEEQYNYVLVCSAGPGGICDIPMNEKLTFGGTSIEALLSLSESNYNTLNSIVGDLETVVDGKQPAITPGAHIADAPVNAATDGATNAATNAATDAPTNLNVITTLLGTLTGELNATNAKQNDLAAKYNDLAAKYNDLAVKYNAAAAKQNDTGGKLNTLFDRMEVQALLSP